MAAKKQKSVKGKKRVIKAITTPAEDPIIIKGGGGVAATFIEIRAHNLFDKWELTLDGNGIDLRGVEKIVLRRKEASIKSVVHANGEIRISYPD
jgi:hypothetical protein